MMMAMRMSCRLQILLQARESLLGTGKIAGLQCARERLKIRVGLGVRAKGLGLLRALCVG